MVSADPQMQRVDRLKRLVWTAANAVALGGLCPWLQEDYLNIEHRSMPLHGLGSGFEGARIALIADLHSSPLVLDGYLHRCVEFVNDQRPDFVCITGDLVTGGRNYARKVARVLRELAPSVATMAVLGNHDYGVFTAGGFGRVPGLDGYLTDQLTAANVRVMLNESAVFRRGDSTLRFVGLHDAWSPRYSPQAAFDATAGVPTIALCHNPEAAEELARHGAQWVLSGHTHGKATPDTLAGAFGLSMHRKTLVAGQYPLDGGSSLYINRGLGHERRTRRDDRPEITVLTMVDAAGAQSRTVAAG
jgi:predicted MPP superfamily phosphohydrolase